MITNNKIKRVARAIIDIDEGKYNNKQAAKKLNIPITKFNILKSHRYKNDELFRQIHNIRWNVQPKEEAKLYIPSCFMDGY